MQLAMNLKICLKIKATDIHTSGQILQDSGRVHCSGGTDTTVGGRTALQETMDTTHRELKACNDRIQTTKGR